MPTHFSPSAALKVDPAVYESNNLDAGTEGKANKSETPSPNNLNLAARELEEVLVLVVLKVVQQGEGISTVIPGRPPPCSADVARRPSQCSIISGTSCAYAEARSEEQASAETESTGIATCKKSRRENGAGNNRPPNDHINTRILQTMISGIPLVLDLGTRMRDPNVYTILYHILYYTILYHTNVYVVSWAPTEGM